MIALLHQHFIQNAILAGTFIAIISAIIGFFVVIRSQTFTGRALSDISFAGATGAAVMGINSLVGIFIFTVTAGLGIGLLGKRLKGRDIEIGMILSFALGLGILFLKLYTASAAEAVNILFGSILSVTSSDLIIILIVGVFDLVCLMFIFRPLLFSSFDPQLAQARGVPVKLLSIIFMVLLAITISQAILVVGVLLIFALLIAPAAVASHISNRPVTALLLSVAFGLFFTWLGFFLSFLFNTPVSFFISLLAAVSYLLTISVSHLISPHLNPNIHTEKK